MTTVWPLAAAVGNAADSNEFERDIRPVLAARCYSCHGALRQESDLRVDTVASMLKGGSSGPVIAPGNSGDSPLLARLVATDDDRMPPLSEGRPLEPDEIARIRAWIDQGAAAPADEKPEADPRDHWSFRPPQRPEIPTPVNADWVRNPIDAFIAVGHDAQGLVPQAPAEKRLLLRRVYLDLIGLPPTGSEYLAFENDSSPGAYQRVVDQLLASPQYGERWGWHFMDIWRYSDWWGDDGMLRASQKHIWHWRDWIVESLNVDRGYDQMLLEMLAADELYPTDQAALRATGYLVRPYFMFNRTQWLNEVVENFSKAFLGLTFNCSKCHDHKYDPLLQQDYYRLRAFFEPYQIRTDELPGETDLEKDGLPRAFDANLDVATFLFERGDERRPRTEQPLQPGLPAILSPAEPSIVPVTLPPTVYYPGTQPWVREDRTRAATARIEAARAVLNTPPVAVVAEGTGAAPVDPAIAERAAQVAEATKTLAEKTIAAAELEIQALAARAAADEASLASLPAADAATLVATAARHELSTVRAQVEEELARAELALARVGEGQGTAAELKRMREVLEYKRNRVREKLTQAEAALKDGNDSSRALVGTVRAAESFVETEESRRRPLPTTSSGRRTALARWLTARDNPLTARVAVNHLWTRHFGQPLVPTVFDFGRKGTPPLHPELLDWLAVELMDNDWSLKHLHRLMVTSATYRMASSTVGAPEANEQIDPENRWHWHMASKRMEAEPVRDGVLRLAGELDLTMGGPPVDATSELSRRRSIYFMHSLNDHNSFLHLFDDASVLECYRRQESIVPQQALALTNSKLAILSAEKISQQIHGQIGEAPNEKFIQAAFELVLATPPTAAEQEECLRLFAEINGIAGSPTTAERARLLIVLALLNHNDFVTIR